MVPYTLKLNTFYIQVFELTTWFKIIMDKIEHCKVEQNAHSILKSKRLTCRRVIIQASKIRYFNLYILLQ